MQLPWPEFFTLLDLRSLQIGISFRRIRRARRVKMPRHIGFLGKRARGTVPWYFRRTPARPFGGGAYLRSVSPKPSGVAARWGVVQPVGHLTVNEDGGGSNPPAPANFLWQKLSVGKSPFCDRQSG